MNTCIFAEFPNEFYILFAWYMRLTLCRSPSACVALCLSIQFRLRSRISITYFYFYHLIEWNTSNFNWLDWKQTMVVFPDILASYQFPQPFGWWPRCCCCSNLVSLHLACFCRCYFYYATYAYALLSVYLYAYEIYLWYIALWLSLAMVVGAVVVVALFTIRYFCVL